MIEEKRTQKPPPSVNELKLRQHNHLEGGYADPLLLHTKVIWFKLHCKLKLKQWGGVCVGERGVSGKGAKIQREKMGCGELIGLLCPSHSNRTAQKENYILFDLSGSNNAKVLAPL